MNPRRIRVSVSPDASFSITISYTPYRVPIGVGGRTRVDITKRGLLKWGHGMQHMVMTAKREMKETVWGLMKAAYWPVMALPLTMDVELWTVTTRDRDDDNVWAGVYPARDEMARALGINDSDIVTGKVTFRKGTPERTVITLTGAPREEEP